jgi:enoyl-CoA hydratase/carnithine racemase
VRIVVLRGAGRAFCAGLDLKNESSANDTASGGGVQRGLKTQRRIAEIVMAMRRCPQPIISLIQGAACGGGFSLALASDIRIAGESARMNCAYIRIGLGGCDIGSSYFLPRLVGASLAAELILTGKFINAERALRVGLVAQVVPDADLEAAAQEDIDLMLTTSPLGLRMSKEALNINLDAGGIEAQSAERIRGAATVVGAKGRNGGGVGCARSVCGKGVCRVENISGQRVSFPGRRIVITVPADHGSGEPGLAQLGDDFGGIHRSFGGQKHGIT